MKNNSAMADEIELKLRIPLQSTGELMDCLNTVADAAGQQTLSNRYFDTPKFDLLRAKAALRIRTTANGAEQTLKTRGRSLAGLQVRNEWNWPLASAELNTAFLQTDEVAACWPEGADPAQLMPVFSTDFQRQKWLWSEAGSRIEIVLDQGAVSAGGNTRPLCEVELELLDGEPELLWQTVLQLQETVPLWLSDVSKAERGYQLVGAAPRWQAIPDPQTSVAEQMSVLLTAVQRQLEDLLWQDEPATTEQQVQLQSSLSALLAVAGGTELAGDAEAFCASVANVSSVMDRAAAQALTQLSQRLWQKLADGTGM